MSMTGYDYNFDLAVREVGEQIVVTNSLGRTALYGEIVYLGGFIGVVMEFAGIANAATGRMAILDSSVEVSTAQVETTDTFTVGNQLYFEGGGSSAAGTLVDSATATTVPIGKITAEFGTTGAQTAVVFRPYDQANAATEAILDKAVKVARVVIDAATDYSTTGKAANIPLGSTILDVFAVSTALASGGTAQVFMGTDAVHTAIAMATDQALARMAAGVDDTKLLVTAAVTVKTHAIGDAGIVSIYYV